MGFDDIDRQHKPRTGPDTGMDAIARRHTGRPLSDPGPDPAPAAPHPLQRGRSLHEIYTVASGKPPPAPSSPGATSASTGPEPNMEPS